MQAVEAAPSPRAVGLIRVSALAGRDEDDERFASIRDQRAAIERVCQQRGWVLVDVFDELDVSAYRRPLDKRPGLTHALRLIEANQAQVLVACYFDRLFRQIDVQRQVLKRVEAAGGEVYAADLGEVSHRTASRKLTATMLGAIAEFYAELVREKTLPAKERAVARSVAPFPVLISGYRRGANAQVEVDPVQAPVVTRAFDMRAAGATIRVVRDFLRSSGIPLDYQRTRTLLRSRFVLGELKHGNFVNLNSHPAIVERDVWQRVQQQRLPRGRPAKSDRLLARLGVLRCETCHKPMSVGAHFNGAKRTAIYGCKQPDRACPKPATINAEALEQEVAEYLREANKRQGLATAESELSMLEAELAKRQAKLQRAIATLEDFDDVPGTRERLQQLRESVQEVEMRLAPLLAASVPARRLDPSTEWDRLSFAGQRDLIRSLVARIYVAPGRGAGRVRIYLFGELLGE